MKAGAVRGVALVVSLSTLCGGAERPRVAVSYGRVDASSRRLLAEVRNVGMEPVDLRAKRDAGETRARVVGRHDVVGLLALHPEGSISVVVMSPETGEVVHESVVASRGKTPASVRAVEELHGRLAALNLDVPAAHPEDSPRPNAAWDAGPSSTPPATRAHPPAAFWLGAGAGAVTGTSLSDRVPAALLEARVAPSPLLSLSAFALLPLDADPVSGIGGTADLRARLFGGMLHVTRLELDEALFAEAGLGAAVASVKMEGHAGSSALTGRDDSVATGVGVVAVGVGVRALGWLTLRLDGMGGVATHRSVVQFEGRDVAGWGPSFMALTCGVAVDVVGLGREVTR